MSSSAWKGSKLEKNTKMQHPFFVNQMTIVCYCTLFIFERRKYIEMQWPFIFYTRSLLQSHQVTTNFQVAVHFDVIVTSHFGDWSNWRDRVRISKPEIHRRFWLESPAYFVVTLNLMDFSTYVIVFRSNFENGLGFLTVYFSPLQKIMAVRRNLDFRSTFVFKDK